MKKIILAAFILFLSEQLKAQGLSVNNTGASADGSAMLDVSSVTKGALIPRMLQIQRAAIASPATGLLVYQTDALTGFYYNTGTPAAPNWIRLSAENYWELNGTHIYNNNTGNVGIGINAPAEKLHVVSTTPNTATFTGGNQMYITFAENGIPKGYIGSYNQSVTSDDVDFGTYSGSAGSLHLITQTQPRLTVRNAGNVGINNTNPLSFLDITSTGTGLNGTAMSSTFRTNSGNLGTAVGNEINIGSFGFMAGGNNTALGIRGYRTTAGNDWTGTAILFGYDVDNTTRAAGAGSGFIALSANGNVGLKTASPNGHLQFNNAIVNRKIVLYEGANNDHQYYGFGINGSTLRYQTDATGSDHVFYAASSASTSNELVRITGTGNMGVGGITPGFRLDVNGRMRIRDGGGSAGLWLNNSTNTTTPAFIGMVNDNTTGFYGSAAGWGLSMNTNTGNVGIGNTNPVRPLTFAATLGRKISLYPGGTGDVGFGVAGNRLQIYSDNPNADVALGYDAAGTFNERFAFKPNGAMAVMGNTGNSGQVLTSNGAGSAATWNTMSDLMQSWYTYNTNDCITCYTGTYGTTFAEIPQITTVVNVARRSRLMINAVVNMHRFQFASVLAVFGEIQLQMDGSALGGTTMQLHCINEGYATGTYANYFVDVNPGSYTFRVVGRSVRCEPSCGGLLPTFNAKYMTIVALPIN